MSDLFQDRWSSLMRNLHSMAVHTQRSSAREASDLVQETLARALPDLLAGRPRNVGAFLARVMRNIVIDDARRDQRRGRMVSIHAHDFAEPAAEPPFDADLVKDLKHTLSQLDGFDRAVIKALFFDDLTETKAAAELCCSRRNVRAALERARHSLKALLHK